MSWNGVPNFCPSEPSGSRGSSIRVRAPTDQAQALEGALREAIDHGARLEKLRRRGDSEVLLELLRDLGGDDRRVRVVATDRRAEVDVDVQALAVRETGVGEELLRGRRVEAPARVALAREGDLARGEEVGDGGARREEVLDDLVAVDALGDRLADADVVERLLGVVEAEEQRVQPGTRVELEGRVVLDGGDVSAAGVSMPSTVPAWRSSRRAADSSLQWSSAVGVLALSPQ